MITGRSPPEPRPRLSEVLRVKEGRMPMDPENPTVPITPMDVKKILKEIGREISSTKSDHLLTALNYVKLDLGNL
jgi:hypothetical protein